MKRKLLVLSLLAAALLFTACFALAETDPIVCTMEVSPAKLAAPGPVNVTISISNSGDTDMKDPLVLYNPVSQVVSDFGTNGAVLLKAGETKTWTGSWDVNQRTLENGTIVFFVKYTLYKDSGESYAQSQPVRGKINQQSAAAEIDVRRTISPPMARDGQKVTVQYDITNTGTVALTDIKLTEHKDIAKKVVAIGQDVQPGETAQIKLPVTMGKKDLTSSATITYKGVGAKDTLTYEVKETKITYGEPAMSSKLTASAQGVAVNEKLTLKLELTNKGTVDYSDLRVTDATLGEVFTNQTLAANGSLTLEKEITLTATTTYQFTVTAIDNTGTEVSLLTDSVTVNAVDPNEVLHISVVATPDRTEVYTQPGIVRFSISVTNDSTVDAKDVTVMHGDTKLYTFATLAAGQTRTLTRDTALSMEGKFQFSAATKDPFGTDVSFKGNEVQIAFSVPTPAPATPTPPANPTAEPTFQAATVASIHNAAIGTVPKFIQSILLPVLIVGGLLLFTSLGLLIVAGKRRSDRRKASESAYDHLERSKRRDYVTPSEEPEAEAIPSALPEGLTRSSSEDDAFEDGDAAGIDEIELPHLKYARNAAQTGHLEEEGYGSRMHGGLYDDDLMDDEDSLTTYGGEEELGEYESKEDGYTQDGYDSYDAQNEYVENYDLEEEVPLQADAVPEESGEIYEGDDRYDGPYSYDTSYDGQEIVDNGENYESYEGYDTSLGAEADEGLTDLYTQDSAEPQPSAERPARRSSRSKGHKGSGAES